MKPDYVFLVTLFIPLMSGLAFSDSGMASTEDKRDYLIAGMRAEREKLRSGHLVMRGKHSLQSQRIKSFNVPFRYEIYFDNDVRKYRHPQSDYVILNVDPESAKMKEFLLAHPDLPHSEPGEADAWISKESGGTVVHTPEYDLYRAIGSTLVTRMASGKARGTHVKEWDFRAFGILEFPALRLQMRLDKVLQIIGSDLQPHSVEIDPSGFSQMTFQVRTGTLDYWIDEKSGMTPVRHSRMELIDVPQETSRSDLDWININDVWVPASMKTSGSDNEISESYELTIEWSNVNESLDPKVFTPEGITDTGAFLTDIRLAPIIVERVNTLPLRVVAATPKPVKPKPPSRLGWIVLSHLIAGGGFAWWYYRRKSRRQSA